MGNGSLGVVSGIDGAFSCNFNFNAIEYFDDTSGNTLHFVEGSDDYRFALSEVEVLGAHCGISIASIFASVKK